MHGKASPWGLWRVQQGGPGLGPQLLDTVRGLPVPPSPFHPTSPTELAAGLLHAKIKLRTLWTELRVPQQEQQSFTVRWFGLSSAKALAAILAEVVFLWTLGTVFPCISDSGFQKHSGSVHCWSPLSNIGCLKSEDTLRYSIFGFGFENRMPK